MPMTFDQMPDESAAPAAAASLPNFDAMPDESQSQSTDPGPLEATGRGFLHGATAGWSDQLSGLLSASGLAAAEPYLTDEQLAAVEKTGGPSGAYATARNAAQSAREAAQAAHPYLYGAGDVAGAVAPMVALGPEAAPTLLGRVGQAAGVGAAYGAVSGAAPGEDLTSKLTGAGVGAGLGAAAGAIGAPISEGVGKAVESLGAPVINAVRGAVNPDAEAARRIITAAQRDWSAQGPSLSPAEIAAARQAGIPRALIDAGGETTRALARSAANTSPEARSALTNFINDRFETQAPRAAAFIDQLVGGAPDVGATRDALQAAARQANRPAYAAAYQAGSQGLWSPELERLSGSPALVQAMREAAQNGQTRAIADGFGAFNPGVNVTPDGRLLFNRSPTGVPTYPDLQFWDYAYRNLRDAGQQAVRVGRTSEGGAINSVAGALRDELDNLVPEYQDARQGAARWFGANDALEAGQNFVTQRMGNADAQRAVNAMSPPERELFMRGYASQLINKVNESGDRRSITNVFGNTPADRQRAVIALGPQRANQLEAYVRSERVLDAARGAVGGNSTTARQLMELGLAGGAYGFATQGDITHPTPGGVLAGVLAYGAMRGNAAINQRLAQRVGEMLTSDDPAVLRQGFQLLGRNGSFLNALRNFDTASLTAAGTKGARLLPSPSLQMPATAYGAPQQQNVPGPPGQKKGGRVERQKPVASKHDRTLKPKFHPEAIGARQAKDGRYYVFAPHARGNYQLVVPKR